MKRLVLLMFDREARAGRGGLERALWVALGWALLTPLDALAGTPPHCVARPYPGVEAHALRHHPGETDPTRYASAQRAASTGTLHLLVILAESNVTRRIGPARFETMLFGPAPSVTDFYREASNGRLEVTGDVFGWVSLPETEIFYSGGTGVGGVGPYPNNGQRMAEDAVDAAIAQGLDLSNYDRDGDGVVDALLVVHSGQGFEWAGGPGATLVVNRNAINSHKWVTQRRDFGVGTEVMDYFTCPELQLVSSAHSSVWTDSLSTMGVYCHELGHILGLPDFYDTQTGDSHLSSWALMDTGNWNRVGTTHPQFSAAGSAPGLFCAWSRIQLGWTEPVLATPGVGETFDSMLTLESGSLGGAPAQLLVNAGGTDWAIGSPGSGEYFLAEVRSRTGYDNAIPGEGLLITHVDESRVNNNESINGATGRLLSVVPRDDSFPQNLATDVWPGPGRTSFDSGTSPPALFYDGRDAHLALSGISESTFGDTLRVTFDASLANLVAPVPLAFARPHPWRPSVHGNVRFVLGVQEDGPGFEAVDVYNVSGRLLRTLDTTTFSFEGRLASWDGRDDRGRALPSGVYFFRTRGAPASATGRVLLLR